MKKILLGALLLLSMISFSQNPPYPPLDTFAKKYTSYITKEKDVLQPWVKSEITVVFNAGKLKDVVFYYPNGNTRTFHQIVGMTKDTTTNGDAYQIVECLDESGDKVAVQLFEDDKCLRVIIAKGYYVEFHKN